MKKIIYTFTLMLIFMGCQPTENNQSMSSISNHIIEITVDSIQQKSPTTDVKLIERGVKHAAKFWQKTDGTEQEFTTFCIANFATSVEEKATLFATIQTNLETLFGNYNKISVHLKLPLHVVGSEVTDMDEQFGALDPFAHFSDDMFVSKIAFTTLLNFPFYTLEEKNSLGKTWTRQEWAYARLGDLFNARVPAEINQELAKKEHGSRHLYFEL